MSFFLSGFKKTTLTLCSGGDGKYTGGGFAPNETVLELHENGGVLSLDIEQSGESRPGVVNKDNGVSIESIFGLLKVSIGFRDLGRALIGLNVA